MTAHTPTRGEELSGQASREAIFLQAAGRGDQTAYGDLYDLLELRVIGMLRSIVISPCLAELLSIDAHLDVWCRAPQFNVRCGTAAAFVLTIARDCGLRFHHRGGADNDGPDYVADTETGWPLGKAIVPVGAWHDMEQQVAAACHLHLMSPTPGQRERIIRRYALGYRVIDTPRWIGEKDFQVDHRREA